MFREAPRTFNDEGTPAEFSHGTSLSSLTLDDDDFPVRVPARGTLVGHTGRTPLNGSSFQPRSRGDGKDSTTTSERSQRDSPSPSRPSRDPVRSSIPRPHTRSQDAEAPREGRPVSRTSSEGPPPVRKEPLEATDDQARLAALIKSGMPSSK